MSTKQASELNDVSGDEERLNWRSNPFESFSGWKIEVTREDDPCVAGEVYHVHSCVLSLASKYFQALFRSCAFRESSTQSSQIKLKPDAASQFPTLLDYLYKLPSYQMTTENTADLHHLAQFFDIPSLRSESRRFLSKDLCLQNCHIYYMKAAMYCNDELLESVEELCAKSLSRIHAKSENGASKILKAAPPEFWSRILMNEVAQRKTELWHAPRDSEIVVSICTYRGRISVNS